ncbi:MAG: GTP pyrophosphokinase, (p)ppGpp synthetase I, partial [uncultured Chloroflexia bacterium]
RELLRKAIKEDKEQQALLASDPLLHMPAYAPPPKDVATKFGIHVHGANDIYTRLAGCCNPVVGEDVVGFVTRGKGLTIHRAVCYNIVNERDRERLMDVSWGSDKEEHQHYPVPIRIECWDRIGLWRDVTEPIANMGVSISSVQQLKNRHADRVTLIATVMVDSLKQLTDIIDKLNRVQQVIEARRDHVPTA